MKSLCITGNTQYGVDQLAHVVAGAGAQPARPAQGTPTISMDYWHQAVLADRPGGSVALAAPLVLGRVWDQLAGDIFLANHTQPLWYWAHTRSTRLLDFWLEFDPNTRFVLVYTDPVTALSHALFQEQARETTLDDLLDDWIASTRQMLRFHLRQPERSVFLLDTSSAAPKACLALLNQRLDLGMQLGSGLDSTHAKVANAKSNRALDSFNTKTNVSFATPEAPAHPTLARHLVSQFLDQHPHALALHEEALACVTNVGAKPVAITPLTPREALDRLRQEKAGESSRVQATLQAEQRAKQFEAQQQEVASLTARVAALDAQLKQSEADLKAARDTISGEGTRKVTELENQIKDITEENELLLEQLHMVQEELERYYLNLKQAESDKAGIEQRLKQAESDKTGIEQRLAHAEKTCEELAAKAAETARTQEHRIARFYARQPQYWDCEQLAVVPLPPEGDAELAEWTLTGLETAGRFIPRLRFKTRLSQGVAGLIIMREDDSDAPLVRWPESFAEATELPCIPTAGNPFEGSNLALSSLSASDWSMLQNVVVYLVGQLEAAAPGSLPPGMHHNRLLTGLAQCAQALRNWPTLLRFNTLRIEPITSIPNYAGLAIELQNVRLGDTVYPSLQYRLSSVDTEPGRFGQHPRLEFPESTRAALQSWFAETSDDRGERLELRFAQPNAVDLGVWHKLAKQDQSLIAALISALPVQLPALPDGDTEGPSRQTWQTLAYWMVQTLAQNLRGARR